MQNKKLNNNDEKRIVFVIFIESRLTVIIVQNLILQYFSDFKLFYENIKTFQEFQLLFPCVACVYIVIFGYVEVNTK